MKSARNTLPEEPLNGVTGGIDWARDDHAVSVVDARGRELHRCTVEHSAAGLRELLTVLAGNGVGEVAIERPDGPVVDALLEAGITVVVISPNQLKNLRGRYGSAGNKDDRRARRERRRPHQAARLVRQGSRPRPARRIRSRSRRPSPRPLHHRTRRVRRGCLRGRHRRTLTRLSR